MKVLTFGQSKAQLSREKVKALQEEHKQLLTKLKAKHNRHIDRNKADYERVEYLSKVIQDNLMGPV